MKRLFSVLAALAALVSCAPRGNNADITLLAGTFTSGSSEGVYSFSFDPETGETVALGTVKTPNPAFLIQSADKVYLVNENNTAEDAVSLFRLGSGEALPVASGSSRTDNTGPCHVSTNGSILLASNYSGGSLDVFPLAENGSILPFTQVFKGSATGPHPNQAEAHVHCSVFTPDGKYVLASDFSGDRIMHFAVDGQGLEPLAEHPYTDVEPGTGPRHITFSPDGRHAYVIGELSGRVTAFDYADGVLETIQTVQADSLGASGSADIHLSPDGRFLYASNRLKGDGIAIFSVDPESGLLEKAGYQPTGVHPRNFALSPDGRFLLCACRDDNVIQVFSRDEQTGLLTNTGRDISVPSPVCVLFLDVR